MFPEENHSQFYKQNKGIESISFDYPYYLELKLSNLLNLLNNPSLMSELGLERSKIIEEAKKLTTLSSMITIPEIVEEKQKKGFFK